MFYSWSGPYNKKKWKNCLGLMFKLNEWGQQASTGDSPKIRLAVMKEPLTESRTINEWWYSRMYCVCVLAFIAHVFTLQITQH